jgi:uncharacterized membrane protein
MSTSTPLHGIGTRYNLRWHVIFTHFPISFFMVSAGLMALHLFTETECFELAGFLSLVAGTVMLIPTTITGWRTWKSRYKGASTALFQYKIRIAFGMIALRSPCHRFVCHASRQLPIVLALPLGRH